MSTAYHAKYFAYELTRQGRAGEIERLSRSLFDACVDLNPHQIDAAVFALQSPIAKGVLLADEVGLGKTIEAGLVLCQYWAEKKRRLLVICPAHLRKQWSSELTEKFHLPNQIIDSPAYRKAQANGSPEPLLADGVAIVSIAFASRMKQQIRAVPWDLAVLDEAHKLRNVYRPSNVMGQAIKWAIEPRRKILLTATPLQNSLLELYGLSTIIDGFLFGDRDSFRDQFASAGADMGKLRQRLRTFCNRTLRKQVVEYIRYTDRRLITQSFDPTTDEQKLYTAISAFLQREDTYAIPKSQRHLLLLIVRKLLASSSKAIADTLDALRARLEAVKQGLPPDDRSLAERIIAGQEIDDDYLEELAEAEEQTEEATGEPAATEPPPIDRKKLDDEIRELDQYARWARSIGVDSKTRALLTALTIGFGKMAELGARRKAVIFTESRRTQEYLKDFLDANGFAGRTVLINGTNSSPEIRAIYDRWVEANTASGRASGSRAVDIRTAIIEHFRDNADIMIATEAAAEGVNLQFCSLVINYDLPWNPQRIEQRIGRCHRYGQQFDVVVINFLNAKNDADRRVHELLDQKFHLFDGIFGASDEVMGTIESGVDFEKRVLAICQQCRTPEQIEAAFNQLQADMEEAIRTRMDETRQLLLEHFDQDVHTRLKGHLENARDHLHRFGRLFWMLTQFILAERARFNDELLFFDLHNPPRPDIRPGRYQLVSKDHANITGEFLYRLSHPLGEHVLDAGKQCPTPVASVTFDITSHPTKVSMVEALRGQSGWLTLQHLTIDSFDREQHLLFSASDDQGQAVDQEACEKLFLCQGSVAAADGPPPPVQARLDTEARRHADATISRSTETNNQLFQAERDKLDHWAEDMVLAVEKELADTKAQIRSVSRQARQAATVQEQHELQLKVQSLETAKRRLRERIFQVEDEIDRKRDALIEALERQMAQRTSTEPLFTIRWSVV